MFFGIIHLVVESITFNGAVTKGGATANRLAASGAESAGDDDTLASFLGEAPARQGKSRLRTHLTRL